MKAFSERFTERKVARWAIGYLGVSWGGAQVMGLLWDVFEWPLAPLRVLLGLVALGFPLVIAFAWFRGRPGTAAAAPRPQPRRHIARALASVVIILALLGAAGATVDRSLDRRWARADAVLEVRRLAEAGEFAAALGIVERARAILPDLPVLDSLVETVSARPAIETEPSGATVLVKPYDEPDGPWREVGQTPLADVRVPIGLKRWRVVHDGFEPLELAANADAALKFGLRRSGSIAAGMVLVPAHRASEFVTGIGPLEPLATGDYQIGRYEVTNEEYREFVDAGGYTREDFWSQPFVDGGRRLSWAEAMGRFVDATGRPGPATWEGGRPGPGQERLPVGGVSWYEAAAYAEFRGASLPTLRHWVRAAGVPLGGAIIPFSNFGGDGPAAPGTFHGMSPSGAFDMAGNLREWVATSAGDARHALGGAWSDPSYFFSGPNVQSPFDRLPVNGFRLATYETAADTIAAERDLPLATRDYTAERPVSDDVFRVFARQFDYDPAPLDARVEETVENELGRVERISFAGVGWGRIHGYLYLPGDAAAPLQTVVYFPGSNAALLQPDPPPDPPDRIRAFVASGRAVFWPVVRGTFSRAEAQQPPNMQTTWPKQTREYIDHVRSWVSEVRRSVDYLASRSDIDSTRIAFSRASWGGRLAAIIPAVEPRFRLNLVMLGGLASGTALPEVDQINYITRVTQPTLMLNGRHDPLEPIESAQRPMFRLLGTPIADKRHVIFDGFGHGLPLHESAGEMLDWLDRYFGPPARTRDRTPAPTS